MRREWRRALGVYPLRCVRRRWDALYPPVGAHGWARRPRVPLELYRRERQRTEASTSGGGVIASPSERSETLKLNPSKKRVSEFANF